jgi:hypothetical protein
MPTDSVSQRLDPQDIGAVARTWNTEHVNKYLSCGWVITALVNTQTGPESFSLHYHLGWPRHLGEVKQPDLGLSFGKSRLPDGTTPQVGDNDEIPF